MEWTEENRPCPVCNSEKFRTLGKRGGRAHRKSLGVETSVVRCRSCHLVYPRPFLLPNGNPYEQDNDSYFDAHETNAKRESGRALARHAEHLLGRKGTMLELGCGHGYNLLGAREEGWTVRGVEMTETFLSQNDLDVEISPLESAKALQGHRYDVILLAAVLEHVYDPVECLRKVHGALKENGLVFIDVPNECSLGMRVGNAYMRARGRDWAINLSPTFSPFHVVGFCPDSLRRALDDTGFQVVELTQHRWKNMLGGRGLIARTEHAMFSVITQVGKWTRMADGISCWARKG